jgi:rSAM/selenodomain-associated transferase 1
MAKHPVPGRVKTRLAAALGDETACALQRAFLLDLADRLRALPYAVTWAFWPPSAPFAALIGDARCRPQSGSDLGDRMVAAIEAEMAEGAGPVVVLGADVPHVDLACVEGAVRALAGHADVVLGPALDGGYYLIGVRAAAPALFQDVPWGTDRVLRATLRRAERLRLRVTLVAESFDIDHVSDLARLRGVMARADMHLPRTRAVLDGLTHVS